MRSWTRWLCVLAVLVLLATPAFASPAVTAPAAPTPASPALLQRLVEPLVAWVRSLLADDEWLQRSSDSSEAPSARTTTTSGGPLDYPSLRPKDDPDG